LRSAWRWIIDGALNLECSRKPLIFPENSVFHDAFIVVDKSKRRRVNWLDQDDLDLADFGRLSVSDGPHEKSHYSQITQRMERARVTFYAASARLHYINLGAMEGSLSNDREKLSERDVQAGDNPPLRGQALLSSIQRCYSQGPPLLGRAPYRFR
jgi:hypothetical protein